MEYAVEISSCGKIDILSFMKTGTGFKHQKSEKL
jgi:hypothetical protein